MKLDVPRENDGGRKWGMGGAYLKTLLGSWQQQRAGLGRRPSALRGFSYPQAARVAVEMWKIEFPQIADSTYSDPLATALPRP
jgi:hypothetical protein